MAACGLDCSVPSGRGGAGSGWRMACGQRGCERQGSSSRQERAYGALMDERQAAAAARSVCDVLLLVLWVILAAWRWDVGRG